MTKRSRHAAKKAEQRATSAATPTPPATPARSPEFWRLLAEYNGLNARERPAALQRLGVDTPSADLLGLLAKSHFVIPGMTRFECQRCGECCRYARKVANFTYDPCPFLSEQNTCSKHGEHYLVCRWFPFFVHHDPRVGDLLTIKPYCTGYGQGDLVDYQAKVQQINDLSRTTQEGEDGAWIIHEVLFLPDRGEWSFPSRKNLDHLLQVLAGKKVEPDVWERPRWRSAELLHAQHYTSGLIGSIKDPQFTVDEQGNVTDVNDEFCQLAGRDGRELVESKWDRLFVNSESLGQSLKQCFSTGKITGIPQRVLLPDGETSPVLLSAMTYRDRTDGLVHGALVCVRKVSAAVFNDLLQSQSYARGLLEASLDPLVFLDVDGTVLDVNEALVLITGRTRESLLGSRFQDYFASPQDARQGIELTLLHGQVRNHDLELVDLERRSIPVQFNATVYKNQGGAIEGIFASARDVREMKLLITELRRAKDYARGLIESGLDLMVTVDKHGTITDVNEAAVQLTGTSRERLIGSSFVGVFDNPERAREGVERCFEQGLVRNYELNIRRSGESPIPVSFNASVYRNANGEVQGVFGIARDIRDRLSMIHQLEEARQYARGLIESSLDLMVTIDREGVVTDVNQEAERLTGKGREQLIGSAFASHFADQSKAWEGVQAAFARGAIRNVDLVLLGAQGRAIPVSFNASLYQDSSGRVAGAFAIARTRDA